MSAPVYSSNELSSIEVPLTYLAEEGVDAGYRVWPTSSGRQAEGPSKRSYPCTVYDCRDIAQRLDLDADGFLLCSHPSAFLAYLNDEQVTAAYYPQIEVFLRRLTRAAAVFAFDHNVRSAKDPAKHQPGLREPVAMVHGDYTDASGRRRAREVLQERAYSGPKPHRVMLINVWRPLHGPVLDRPLAICRAPSVSMRDLVATPIEHYANSESSTPKHQGEIFSVLHATSHRWFFASRMLPEEVFVFKGYDSDPTVAARFTPHTSFTHPECPADFTPRESIEVRALVVDPAS